MKKKKNNHHEATKTRRKSDQDSDPPPDRMLSYCRSKEGKRRIADRAAGFRESLFPLFLLAPALVALSAFAATSSLAQTPPQPAATPPPTWQSALVAELKTMKPLPKVTLSWPWPDEVFADVPLRDELARVTRSVGVSLRWSSPQRIKEALAAEPEVLAFHWSPFHDKFQDKQWTDPEAWGTRELDYFAFFRAKCAAAKMIIGDQRAIVILDHEKNWPKDSAIVDRKLAVFYHIAKYTIGGEVVYYNWGQWGPGYRRGPPRASSPVSPNVPSDLASASIYYQPGSVENDVRLRETARRTDKPLMIFVSIGNCFEERPYTPRGVAKRSGDVIAPVQLGQTWNLARRLYRDPRVKYLCLWPEVFDPDKPAMIAHVPEFFRGALGITHDHQPLEN